MYSSLIANRQDEFYLRILVHNFLRINMKESKLFILTKLKELNNDDFLKILRDHHLHYVPKPISNDHLIKTYMGTSNLLIKHFNLSSIKVNNYLDFGCGTGIKTKAIGNCLKVSIIHGMDIENVLQFDDIYYYHTDQSPLP